MLVNTNNPLILRKGNHAAYSGWASADQLKGELRFPWGRRDSAWGLGTSSCPRVPACPACPVRFRLTHPGAMLCEPGPWNTLSVCLCLSVSCWFFPSVDPDWFDWYTHLAPQLSYTYVVYKGKCFFRFMKLRVFPLFIYFLVILCLLCSPKLHLRYQLSNISYI